MKRKTICCNDTHKRNFCIKKGGGELSCLPPLKDQKALGRMFLLTPSSLSIPTADWHSYQAWAIEGQRIQTNWALWNCRRVRLREWKQCPLGAWLDVDQLGRKKQTVPKHMATSLQKIQTWLKLVTTNRKHTSFPEGRSHLFLPPRLLFLGAWDLSPSSKARGQSQSPEQSVALEFSTCQLWNRLWSLLCFLCCQTE